MKPRAGYRGLFALLGVILLGAGCDEKSGTVIVYPDDAPEETLVISNQTGYNLFISRNGELLDQVAMGPHSTQTFHGQFDGSSELRAEFVELGNATLVKHVNIPSGGTYTWEIPASVVGGPGSVTDLS
jgi:hypothetical protein